MTKFSQPQPKKQKIEIHLRGDFSALPPDRRIAAIDAFAVLMGVSPQAIDIYSVSPGSIIFKLGAPPDGVDRLRTHLETNNAQLRLLNIEKIILERESGETEDWAIREGKFELVTTNRLYQPSQERQSIKSQLANLYKSLKMEPIQFVETAKLITEAITSAHIWEAQLGEKRKGKAEKAFEALRDGYVKLDNPQASIQRLHAKDFEEQNLQLSIDIKKSMQGEDGYAFYLVTIPVLLYPGRGAQYRLLEGQFIFGVEDGQRPLGIQNIFPKSYWKPVLDWGGSFDLGLDGNLEWEAKVEQAEVKIARLSGQLAGRVKSRNQLASFIKLISFEHTLGRMEIEAQFASSTAMWRLDSKKVIHNQKQTQFVILLKVPKEVNQVRLQAAVQAEVAFDWLAAQIEHVFERLPQTIQRIVENKKGLPLQDFQTWTIDLPN